MSIFDEEELAKGLFITTVNRFMDNLNGIYVNKTPATKYWIEHGWVTVIVERSVLEQSFILRITEDGQAILDFDKL